jgi:glycerol-3-phosphate dehydrogenase
MLALSPELRGSDLARMADRTFDVLVIGGGITGAGVALDAATRGLSVALVERNDFASGTSGRSSRLIHGGLRYLERADVGLVRESLRERATLLRLAPHLVRPFRFYIAERSPSRRAALRAGLSIYNALAAGTGSARHRAILPSELGRAAPGLADPPPGLTYLECRTDDARLTLAVIRTARAYGALVANHAAVSALITDVAGRVTGARVDDGLTSARLDVRAKVTVNATGVWSDLIRALGCEAPEMLRPSKGVHLVLRPGAIATTVAVALRASDGRPVFVLPWHDRTYIGTSDTPYEGDLDEPTVRAEDTHYLLEAVAESFPGVSQRDVIASWAGLRPLLDRDHGHTRDLSRRHVIEERPPGLLTVTGGKLTTYRAMGEAVVDEVARAIGSTATCRTERVRLGLWSDLREALATATAAGDALGLPAPDARRLVHRFGDDWPAAMDMIRGDRSLAEPQVDGLPVLRVEARMGREREMALTDDDLAVRRTRLVSLGGGSAAVDDVRPAGSSDQRPNA